MDPAKPSGYNGLDSSERMTGSKLIWVWGIGGLAVAAILTAVFYPVFAPGRIIDHTTPCLSQVKQLATAAMFYAEDHDMRLMARDSWMDELLPYHKRGRNGLLEHCPAVYGDSNGNQKLYGYAFDSRLAGKDITHLNRPQNHPLIYDSVNLARNASDPFVSLPDPPRRHNPKLSAANNVAYADGHVKARVVKASTR